jgi:predicted transcriptional regulator
MTALSIQISDSIAKDTAKVAKKLGISRTEFIRKAIIHELEDFKIQTQQNHIIKSFNAMKSDSDYLKESDFIDSTNSDLPIEKDEWWNKKY